MSSKDQGFDEANGQTKDQKQKKSAYLRNTFLVTAGAVSLGLLYILSRQNYLLFHSVVEIFSIVIAFAIFAVAWNSRRIVDNNYFIFIGIAFLFVAGLDVFHTLAY